MTSENEELSGLESIKNTAENLEKETQENIKNFDQLIDSLSTAHDKKKALWKQIYQNAINDRRSTMVMFYDLYSKVHGSGSEHAIHGATLAKYMERLNKTNEQLIKLSEIIEEAFENDEDDLSNPKDIYAELEKND